MQIHIRQIPEIGGTSFRGKEDIPFPPEDERRGLLVPQKGLPLGVQGHILAVIVEEVKLSTVSIRTCKKGQVHVPGIRANPLGITMAVEQAVVFFAVFAVFFLRFMQEEDGTVPVVR